MKLNKTRIIIFALGIIFSSNFLFAEKIELPEVTTVITGDTEKADSDALSDFDDVMKLPKGRTTVEPVLPELKPPVEEAAPAAPQVEPEKSLKVEGYAGGGYPVLIKGDLAVSYLTEKNLFEIDFSHDSAAAYTNHSLTENYFDRNTSLEINNSFKNKNFLWNLKGAYKTFADGLQQNLIYNNHVINQLTRDNYNVSTIISYEFSNGIITGAQASLDFYNRYADSFINRIPTFLYMEVSPELFIKWHGYGFEAGLTANYLYSDEIISDLKFLQGHRAEFALNLQWQNDYVKLYGNVAAVIGNQLKEKPVIVPFTVGVDASFPVSFSDKRYGILAEGGIKSYRSGINQLENKYKFALRNNNTTETSDWFGKLTVSVPVLNFLTATTTAEYRRTAYDNGVLEPDYHNSDFSIYGFEEKEHQLLITDFQIKYNYENFSVTGGWHSNWLDCPVLENVQTVNVKMEYKSSSGKWGINASGSLAINSEFDIPEIGAGGFVQITPYLSAELYVNDIIKLYKGETRSYAGKYVSRGGSVILLLKFIF